VSGFPGVCESALDAIGGTPLVALRRLGAGLPGLVLAKVEAWGPGGSVKDRVALRMIRDAEAAGRLRPGDAIVEATSGNTGIGLALVAGVRGYRFIAVLSAGNSVERRRMLAALGAEVVVVPQAPGSVPGEVSGEDLALVAERAAALTEELRAFRPDQFANPSNTAAHEEATAAEIWQQTGGRVDAFVACVGTSGSFTGVARGLKARNPAVRCLAVEPAGAEALAGRPITCANHKLQGSGYSMVPPLWDPAVCDGCVAVTDAAARETARALAAREGLFTGYTSGANVHAALCLAAEAPAGTVVVTLCPDTGLKYLSTDLFASEGA